MEIKLVLHKRMRSIFCLLACLLVWSRVPLCNSGRPRTLYVAQAGLRIIMSLLPQPLWCWDYRCAQPHPMTLAFMSGLKWPRVWLIVFSLLVLQDGSGEKSSLLAGTIQSPWDAIYAWDHLIFMAALLESKVTMGLGQWLSVHWQADVPINLTQWCLQSWREMR